MKDVVIIGAGVIGCAVARELSKYKLDVCVVEAGEDVCTGTSKANSGIVHAGFDAAPGSNKARFNVLGSRMMPELTKTLDVPFKRNGALVVCTDPEKRSGLDELLDSGVLESQVVERIAKSILATHIVFHVVFIERLGKTLAHLTVGEAQQELSRQGVVLLQRQVAALEQHGNGVADAFRGGIETVDGVL